MSNLKSALLSTPRGVNESFDAALSDLQEVVAEADDAVKAVAQDMSVRIVQREKKSDGFVYLGAAHE